MKLCKDPNVGLLVKAGCFYFTDLLLVHFLQYHHLLSVQWI